MADAPSAAYCIGRAVETLGQSGSLSGLSAWLEQTLTADGGLA